MSADSLEGNLSAWELIREEWLMHFVEEYTGEMKSELNEVLETWLYCPGFIDEVEGAALPL